MSEVLRSPHKTKRATTAAVFGTFLPLLVSNSAQGTAAEHTSEEIKLYFVDPQYDKHQRCYYETNLKRPDQDPGQFRFLGLALCRNQHERETLTGQVSVTKPNGDYFWVDGTYYLGHGHTKNGKYSYL
ncbi:MAG TPA: hypothetical protein VG604_04595, partial [Candidatus Saccharimonadales bacterium]|nr:hypothetical protein [Candidatus Saccharimonadales bacterium]